MKSPGNEVVDFQPFCECGLLPLPNEPMYHWSSSFVRDVAPVAIVFCIFQAGDFLNCGKYNGPFPSCCLSRFRSESWCSTIVREMSLICIRIRNSFPFEWLCARTRFETEACSNSEMGYWLHQCSTRGVHRGTRAHTTAGQ